jgi:arylsulfatase A
MILFKYSLNKGFINFFFSIFMLQSLAFFAQKTPNFILIVTDDQGWTHTSLEMDKNNPASKSDYLQTPAIEELGKNGMRFSRGYAAAPVCSPSRYAIQFGKTPARIQYTSIVGSYVSDVNHQQITIAQLLKKANKNYVTAHFGKWHMEVDPKVFGYDISDGNTENMYGSYFNKDNSIKWKGFTHEDPKRIFSVTQRASDFMENQVEKNKPFFMQVSHYANHDHLMAKPETLKKFENLKKGEHHNNAMYAAMTADLDEGIGLLLKKVKELGIEDNTYIIFTSDNGGVPRLPPNRNQYEESLNYPLQRGKWDLTEGGIRVPLIISGPGIEKNSQSNEPVVGYDFLPTILELAGNSEKIPTSIDGASFAPLLLNKGNINRKENGIIFHYPHYNHFGIGEPHSAIIKDDYKLIKMQASGKTYLFDLKNDKEEKKDLKSIQPKLAQTLEKSLDTYLESVEAEQMQFSKNWLRGEGASSEKFPFDSTQMKNKGILDGFDTFQAILDLSKERTVLKHAASGFNSGIDENVPKESLLKPLKAKLYRGRISEKNESSGISAFKRMKNLGANIQLVVSEAYNKRFEDEKSKKISNFSYSKIDNWPGDKGDWSLWEKVIEESYKKLDIESLAKDIQWDFWQEPNHLKRFGPYSESIENDEKLNKERFFETYKRGFFKVKRLNADAKIVGPSINNFDATYLKDFLLFAKKNKILPDYLSWHETKEQHYPQQIPIHVHKIRQIMKQNRIDEIPIQINEFVSVKRQVSVAQQIFYLANLERAKVSSAALTCCREKENNKIINDEPDVMGGLFTEKTFLPRATYWPYRYYGEMNGALINVKNLPKTLLLDGIANLDDEHKKIRILLGRTGNFFGKKITFRIDNLNEVSWLKNKKQIKVTIKNIPNSNWNNLTKPEVVFQKFIEIEDNHIDINLMEFKKQEGIYLEIE